METINASVDYNRLNAYHFVVKLLADWTSFLKQSQLSHTRGQEEHASMAIVVLPEDRICAEILLVDQAFMFMGNEFSQSLDLERQFRVFNLIRQFVFHPQLFERIESVKNELEISAYDLEFMAITEPFQVFFYYK